MARRNSSDERRADGEDGGGGSLRTFPDEGAAELALVIGLEVVGVGGLTIVDDCGERKKKKLNGFPEIFRYATKSTAVIEQLSYNYSIGNDDAQRLSH